MIRFIFGFLVVLFTTTVQGEPAAIAAPEVGESAPEFQLQGSDGNTYSLSQFRDKKSVVIAFFPKVFTGG